MMSTEKNDLEIIYSLQWKNRSGNFDDKANVVGMYDIPPITLNWETFKFYLLKNSGVTGDDVKISYLSADEKEFPIESQLDFQISLYSFRKRARMGEIITLKLECVPVKGKLRRVKRIRQANDAQTQVEGDSKSVPQPPLVEDEPPDWFVKYMKQFKEEVTQEVTTSVLSAVAKPIISHIPPHHHTRKFKPDLHKKSNKTIYDCINDKELMKSLKFERKLENKIEKLEHKTMKIKEKKIALMKNAESLNRLNKTRPIGLPLNETECLMDATPLNKHDSFPHMSGGEIYVQEWEVINSGRLPWTEETELRYAWGSQALKPVNKIVNCPHLEPGFKGMLKVQLEIPKIPGNYECYWHFHHQGRRFGHWLGCQVIVDPQPFKLPSVNSTELYPELPNSCSPSRRSPLQLLMENDLSDYKYNSNDLGNLSMESLITLARPNPTSMLANVKNKVTLDLGIDELKIDDGNISSDTDNQSVVSVGSSSSSSGNSDEFVVVPIPSCFRLEPPKSPCQQLSKSCENLETNIKNKVVSEHEVAIESEVLNGKEIVNQISEQDQNDKNNNKQGSSVIELSSDDEIVYLNGVGTPLVKSQNNILENDEKDTGYAYVVVNGDKVSVPKVFLHADYLATAEEAPAPNNANTTIETVNKILNENSSDETANNQPSLKPLIDNKEEFKSMESTYSHCSAAGSSFSDCNEHFTASNPNNTRLFVFPLNCPGFEVIYPENGEVKSDLSGNATVHPDSLENGQVPQENLNWEWNYNHCGSFHHLDNSFGPVFTASCSENTSVSNGNRRRHIRIPVKKSVQSFVNSKNHPHNGWAPNHENLMTFNQQCNFNSNTASSQTPKENMSTHSESFGPPPSTIHILPETLVTGAVNVASSAINTARSVLNMIVPPRTEVGRWENGHWISNNPQSPRERALATLAEMGFWDRNLNATLLARYNDDVTRVISELVQ